MKSQCNTELGYKLYDFQETGKEFLVKTKKALLADSMGLGKTVQAVTAAEVLLQTQKDW